MGNKVKIHEIAKKMGLTSKEILERAKKLGIDATSHLSGIEEKEAKMIEDSYSKNKAISKNDEKTKKVRENRPKKEAKEEPVIIRRQVIVEENEDKNKKERKQENNVNRDVGMIERGRNKDYNIVYRNKPTKPLTVSELFGKKEEPKEEVNKEKAVETAKQTPTAAVEVKKDEERKEINKNESIKTVQNTNVNISLNSNTQNRNYNNTQNKNYNTDRNNKQNDSNSDYNN